MLFTHATMIYCLHHYSIPLFWRWQWVQLQFCKSFKFNRGWDSHRQWVSDASTSGTLSTISEDQTTREADEWWECALSGTEKLGWDTTECCSHLLLSLARPPKPADAAPTTQPKLVPAQGAGSRAAPAQRQAGVREAFAHKWGLHAHTWGPKHLGILVLDICLLKP